MVVDDLTLSRIQRHVDPIKYHFIGYDQEKKVLNFKYFSIRIGQEGLECCFRKIDYDITDGWDVINKYTKLMNFLNMIIDDVEYLWEENEI